VQGLAPRGGNGRVAAILPSSERRVARMIKGAKEKYSFCLSRQAPRGPSEGEWKSA
jgi:hypothetical protein